MKFGVLADIHANADALDVVLSECRSMNIDQLIVAGDFVGYYFYPALVLEMLSDFNVFAIQGNHEHMLKKASENQLFLKRLECTYGRGHRIALEELSLHQLNFIFNLQDTLSLQLGGLNVLVCHGSPRNCNKYVYPTDDLRFLESEVSPDTDLLIMGHTHYPMIRRVSNKLVALNPGSVGQARGNIGSVAQWAVIDTDNFKMQLRSNPYDSSRLREQCLKYHPQLRVLVKNLGAVD